MTAAPMAKGLKIQVTIQLDPDQSFDLDRIAKVRRTSRSAITREAVDLYLSVNRSVDPMVDAPYSTEDVAA